MQSMVHQQQMEGTAVAEQFKKVFALGKVEWENRELGRSAEETFSVFQKHHSKPSKAKLLLWLLGMTLCDFL